MIRFKTDEVRGAASAWPSARRRRWRAAMLIAALSLGGALVVQAGCDAAMDEPGLGEPIDEPAEGTLSESERLHEILARCSGSTVDGTRWDMGGGCGVVASNRLRVAACDTSADGRGVTTWYASDNGAGGNVGDFNGSSPGCGEEGPDGGSPIRQFHVCVGSTCGPEICIRPPCF